MNFLIKILCCSMFLAVTASAEKQATGAKVWIVKPDGSKQCGMEKGVEPKKDAKKLSKKGVKIYESRKGSDGQMHVALCGAASGDTVEHLISAKHLNIATKQGYKELKKEDN